MKITFEVIKYKARRKENGKWRQTTFTQTINPFNKNEDGSVKNRKEVYEAVKREALAWQDSP